MQMNIAGKRILAWLLLLALVMSNLTFDTVAQDRQPVLTEVTETEPAETEPAETEPVETEPVETEPAEPESTDGQISKDAKNADTFADATPLDAFEYSLNTENSTILLSKYIGTDAAVVVAPQYTVDDVVYATILNSATVFRQNTRITSVKLYEGVSFADNTAAYLFHQCSSLKTANLAGVNTSGVVDMSYMFEKCKQLTTVDMTGVDTSTVTTMYAMFSECSVLANLVGYENWNTSSLQNMFWMFNKVQGMQTIDLSKWNLSQVNNSAWCFQHNHAKQILLPDSLKTMSAGFLNHATQVQGSTFTIPAGVEKIGYAHTIYDFATDSFVEFIVAEGNRNYVAIDGILYSADGKEMLAIPRNKTFENNTYVVPEGVEFFGELSFSRNYNIHTLLLPNSYEIVQNIPKHDPRYIVFEDIGNLNAGNSLSIAIYAYTGVSAYEVKADNTRYTSRNGIIYSKDMSTMLAVPTRYNQYMDIPEGVTTIAVEAMWAIAATDDFMKTSTGVNIPSTLTSIAPDQLAKLNRLNQSFANFVITVHPDNPVFKQDDKGNLVAEGVVVARNETTRISYPTLADALTAAQSGDTVTLLEDISLSEMITVSKDVTINGNGHTIIRGKKADDTWYIGTLFSVNAGVTLTLDGNLTIDGGNNWIFHQDKFLAAIEEYRNDTSKLFSIDTFRTLEEGAPQANNDMIKVAGSLILNHATVQNHVGTGSNISAIYVAGTGALTINEGASIRHNYTYAGAGTLQMAAGSTAVMNAGEITDNYGGNRNGPNIDISGSFTMNGGKIHHNYGIKTNGIVLFLHNGGTFILRDGEICENAALKGDSGWHCAIYIHNNATMEMHGGKVWHNSNRISAIHLYGGSSKFIFTGGLLIENDIQQSSYSVYSDINPASGPAVVSGGTCTNDVGAYIVDGYGMAIDRKTVEGKEYIYYTVTNQLIELKSNGKIYPTFDAAMADAVDGDTLTLLRDQRVIVDATKSDTTILDKDVTIDFNGKTLYGWGGQNPVFRILADVTFTGNGTMDAAFKADACCAVVGNSEGQSGKLTVENGAYLGDTSVFSVANGELNIEGGYFEATPYIDENGVDYGHRYTLCCDETAYGDGSANIYVSGGTYYGFDPQDNLAQGEKTDFVVDTHWSIANSAQNTWTVNPYITVTFQDAQMFVGDSVPDAQYVVDYGGVGQDKVKVVVETTTIENPAVGEYEITGTVKLIDGTDKAENYRAAVIPGTLRVTDIVARIVETGERYGTLADAIADANAMESATVELLKDVEFNQLLTVTGNVTVLGNGHTVTRGKQADDTWYTGKLFDISAAASLTLDGNLIIDGNHAWTYRETNGTIDLQNAVDNYQDFTGYDGLRFISAKADSPVATADMFMVKGNLTLDAVTIQNHYGAIGASVIEMGSTGTLTMNNGAVLTHNVTPSYGTLVYMVNGSQFQMNGGVMSQNASAHHGVCIYMVGGVTTVNGGKVMHNHTCGGQGIFVRIDNGELIVNGGEVYENAAFPSTGNSRNKVGAVIDATSKGKVTINDVHIHDNFGYWAGGINHVSKKGKEAFTIKGGKFVNNTAWGAFDEDSRLSDVSFGQPGATITGGTFSTEIYQACVLNANKDSIIPSGHAQFVISTDAEGNPNLWEVAPGWYITFQDADGNVLQSGPVRAGEIPVFSGDVPPHEDDYGIFWDKEIVPATADATYTMAVKQIVAEVVAGDTHKGYFATVQDAVNAAVSGDTVRLLVDDLPVTSVVTVSGKEIALDGNGKTLVRGDSYTGAFFNVPTGGSLTIGGDLTIDGGNEWTYNKTNGVPDLKTVVDNYTTRVPYEQHSFITYESGAPVATDPMMTVGGCVVLDDVTIQNNVGTRIVQMASGGKLTTNSDTVFNHNAGVMGAIINVVSGSEVIMNGGTITQTVSHDHGGCVRIEAGTFTMNGGLVKHNYTTGHASFVRLNGGAFILKDGEICENVALPFGSKGNNAGSVIDAKSGTITVNGGSIHNNFGYMVGGINHIGSGLTITGGILVDNVAWAEAPNATNYPGGYKNDVFFAVPATITGGIFGTEIYGACTGTTAQDDAVTLKGYEEFVIGTDAEGNPNLWEVARGWIITFQDEDGNVLQSGPVREGELPVFDGQDDIPDGYMIVWDKTIVAATEDATYTMSVQLIVAEVVNGETHKGYFPTLQAAVNAAASGDTVRILVDIPLTDKVTVSGKDITLDGNDLTISRGKLSGAWYTGNLFTVEADASLTLDGNLTIDGGNNWTLKEEAYKAALEAERNATSSDELAMYSGFAMITAETGAPVASARMFDVSGDVIINGACIRNHYGSSSNGLFALTATGSLTLNNKALLTHNADGDAAVIAHMADGSELTINEGAEISDSYFARNGGMVLNKGGLLTMNGGKVINNRGVRSNGTFVMLHTNNARFVMNGGEICGNTALYGSGAGWGCAIYLHNSSMAQIKGGTICHNDGVRSGAICCNQAETGAKLYITGGRIVNNEARDGALWEMEDHHDVLLSHEDHFDGITGGFFTQDVTEYCTKGYYAFVVESDSEGNPTLWEVARGWIITFQDESGNVLQSGLVREGTIPVFAGEMPSRDDYLPFWDRELAPATEDTTYTLVWKRIVAEVFVTEDESVHKGYFVTLQDAVNAAASGDTVRILVDIPLTDTVTVSGKNITLDGNDLTITRGKRSDDKWYTGTLLSVGADAGLTLDGNLTVDGANAWILDKTSYDQAFEDFKTTLNRYNGYVFLSSASGAPVANEDMIGVAGSLTINNATLCNHRGGSACSAIGMGNKSKLTLNDGALITHTTSAGAGSVLGMGTDSLFTMNGGKISGNHTINNGMIYNSSGTIIMNNGEISDNTGINCNGSAILLTSSAKFIMNGGKICHNSALPGNENAFCPAVYLHANGVEMIMHGGYIYQNIGCSTGAIASKASSSAKLTIDGGWVVENRNILTEQTVKPSLVEDYRPYNDVYAPRYTNISGITYFTQDVNKWCTTEYIAVPQEPGCMNISKDFTLWIVDKTTMNSQSREKEVFGTLEELGDVTISRDSAYTVLFDVNHFYNRCYQAPALHFSQKLPVNTTVILMNKGNGEKGYWAYTVKTETDSISFSEFIRMGTADEAFETPMVNPEFQLVIDFSKTANGMPGNALDTSLGLVPADYLSTDNPDYYVSGAVRWIPEEEADDYNEKVSISPVEEIILANTIFTLEQESGSGLTNTLKYSVVAEAAASKWDHRELALVVTIPDAPADARLLVNDSRNGIITSERGCFIIPIGLTYEGKVTLTLQSDMFPVAGKQYAAAVRLYASESVADAAPLNGDYLGQQALCVFTSPAGSVSVDVTEADDKHLFTSQESITVTVEHILSEQFEIAVHMEKKNEDGQYILMDQAVQKTGDTYTFSLNACDAGSYRIVAVVKHKQEGYAVTQEPYYFIVH